MWLHYVSCSPPFIKKKLISISYKCFYKLHLLQNFRYSQFTLLSFSCLYRRRKSIYYIRQNVFTFPNYWAIHSPISNHHSIIPWGSFRGRKQETWGSFRGWDHFGVGIISGAVQTSCAPKRMWKITSGVFIALVRSVIDHRMGNLRHLGLDVLTRQRYRSVNTSRPQLV